VVGTDIQACVAAAVAAAGERWPGIVVSADELSRVIAESLNPGDEPPSHADELALATACLTGQTQALRYFDRDYLASIGSAVRRLVTASDEVEDVKQRLREHLLVGNSSTPPRLAAYRGRGSLRAWVEISAKREALMARRSEHARRGREDRTAAEVDPSSLADPEIARMREHYGPSFREAFARGISALEARDRTLLRAYFVDRLSLDQLGAMLGVHRVTAWRHVLSARERFIEAIRNELRGALRTTASELESLMAVMGDEFHITLNRLL
jgi:RNA polymerase sigma-70 factor (ECF subfamily)